MSDRPFVCENGHRLSHGVTTCPRCGTPAKAAPRDLWEVFTIVLVVLSLIGIVAALVNPHGAAGSVSGGTAPETASPTTRSDTMATRPSPGATSTTGPTTTVASSSTSGAATSTVDPGATSSVPVAAPPLTAPPAPPAPPVPPNTQAPAPPVPEAQLRRVAQDALVVAYTTGHAPAGFPPVDVLVAPTLRGVLDSKTTTPAYRAAGCRQEVGDVIDGPGSGTTFGFSFTIRRECDRTPIADGFRLPLVSGAFATIDLGPRPAGGFWATALTPG